MRVIGIDPSISAAGVALPGGMLRTVKTTLKMGDGERLSVLYRELTGMVHRAEFAVTEDLPTHAMSAGLTGRAQGIVHMTLAQFRVPYIAIPPATLKKFATGKGNAKKDAMRQAWLEFTGKDNNDDNQVDAAWLRQVGLHIKGEPVNLPEEQLAAVAAYFPF